MKKWVHRALERVGLRVHRADYVRALEAAANERGVYRERYAALISDVEALYRERLDPELPVRPPRASLMVDLSGTQIFEALHLLTHLRAALEGEGDVCEFGVARGDTSALLASELGGGPRRLWLFDTFAGMPAPGPEDVLIDDIFGLGSIERYEGTMAYPLEQVRSRLSAISFPLERVRIVPGRVEETIARADVPERVAFAYVDLDFYGPIRAALEFLEARLAPRGRIMVDDYGFFSAGAHRAVDEFLAARPGRFERILPSAFGGHFCILRRTGS